IGDRSGEGVTLNNIGVAYDSIGEKQKALESYNQALPILRAAGNRITEARTLTNIGEAYKSLGERRKALDFYDQALAIQRAAGDRLGETTTLNVIGQVYSSLGEMRKALDFFTQSLTIQRAIGSREIEGGTLNNIGYLHHSLGENKQALDFCNQALALDRAAGDRNGEAATLNNIATIYFEYGERQKALDFYHQSLPLSRAVDNRQQEAGTLNNIGHLYNTLGESRKALDFLTQALALARAAGDRSGETATLNNIGSAYRWLGEIQKAIEFYTQALAIHRAAGDRGGEAGLLGNIGGIYSSLGEKQKALDFYNQALTIRRAIGDRSRDASTLNNIALVYNALGENKRALDFYDQALPLARAVGDRQGEAAILNNIAHTKRDLGYFDESRSHVESALKIIEAIRAEVVSKDLRASYFATQQGAYEFYVDLLMRMHSQGPAKGLDAAALEASERARARSLLESLAEANADIRRGADPKLLAQEESLQKRLNAKAEETLKLSANGADEARLAMSRRETDALTIELQQVQTQIRQTSPRYSALTQPQLLTLAEIQRQALDADTLLLEFSLGADRSFMWAVTPTSINSYELPKREEIEATAKRVYELLSKAQGARGQGARPGDSGLKEYSGEYLAAAKSLSRTLLGPVAGQLGKKRLVIVADGMLHYIPFGALPDPNSLDKSDVSWQPLLVEHEIVNLPSASTIEVLRRELAGRKPAAKTLAVLADPVFSRDDERIRPGASLAAQRNAQRDPLDESRARILVEIGGGAPNDLRIKRLPFTRQEAEAIMSLAPAGAGIKALDFEASRATATGGRLSQYRYVHFATHGLADADRPELSTLLLSLYDVQGRPQDGFLRAHEVYNLELPAELVTLSACETGLGKLTKGEGLVSLTRGFMYAGAARVVVSLWSVSDRATAELMTKFYRSVLVRGERPAAALRAAQVEMWRDKRWEAPYYWAAFTLQGEWR
ncbi:MAG TPA: CHAT domain-containing protein, partial [Blastocatellia bacterium]|nr:CHAT domain-containing protein [Blastocatellia bacterium]